MVENVFLLDNLCFTGGNAPYKLKFPGRWQGNKLK